MAHKRISSLYFMADSKDDLTHLLESQMGTTCFVIEDACEYKRTSDGRWIPQMASSIATTPGAGGNVDLTGYATEGYVDTKIANLVGSAPENLNTLHEIAIAFKENDDILDTLNEAIGEKANRSEIPDVSIFQEKGDYALKSEIPSIASLATEEYVDEAIANIEHPLPEVDKAHQVLTTNENGEKIWEDKLCYNYRVDYEVYAETIIPEGKSRIMPSIDVIEPIIENESYIVTWDGVEYPCLAYAREGSDFGTVLGNEYFAYSDQPELDNGLPFLFIGFFAHGVMKLVFAADTNGHVFSIRGSKQTNTVIPGQYIAGGVYAGKGSQSTIIGDPLTAAAPGNSSVSLGGVADGVASVAEGNGTTHSDSQCAHAEGSFTHAYGWVSHVEGYGNTAYRMQHVQGRRAVEDPNSIYADIVGNGSQDGNDKSNAYALDWYGNAYFDGDVFVQGDGKTLNFDGAKKVATEEYVNTKVAELVDNAPETLNTLKEVADALNENASTAEALNQAIGNKVDKTDYPESTNPNQYLTTDAEGNKIWENKLAYSSLETIPFIEEMTWTGAQTSYPTAIANAQAGDKITIFIDDVPYYGILKDDGSITWVVQFDEEYEQQWIQNGKFYISKLGYDMNLGGVPLSWAVGKMSATVTTNIVHPIDNKYLGLNITQGTGDLSMSVNGEAENASGYRALSLNGGLASGSLSVAIGPMASATENYALAAGSGSAKADYSVAFGEWTDSVTDSSMTIGTHNVTDENKEYLFIVGNGSRGEFNPQTGYQRIYSNAHTVNKDGTGWFQKEIKVGGTSEHDENAKKLATEEYVEERYLQNIETFTQTVEWNGDIEGREVFSNVYYKVSNDTPALEDFTGHYLTFADGTKVEIDGTHQAPLSSYPNDGYNINNMIIVFQNDVEGVASKGIYLEWADQGKIASVNYTARKTVIPEKLLDSNLVRATAFNELADTVEGLDKYCAFMKQGDQIKLGNVQEYSKMQKMLNGTNKFHATLAISYVNEEGLLISETCYAKSVMAAINTETGDKPYVNFSFETFNGETVKFRWNADNTISNVTIISAEGTLE